MENNKTTCCVHYIDVYDKKWALSEIQELEPTLLQLEEGLGSDVLKINRLLVDDLVQLNEAWEKIYEEAVNYDINIIHFSTHGTKGGLAIGSGELSWEDLKSKIKIIPLRQRERLIVFLSACQTDNAVEMAYDDEIIFQYVVVTSRDISIPEGIVASKSLYVGMLGQPVLNWNIYEVVEYANCYCGSLVFRAYSTTTLRKVPKHKCNKELSIVDVMKKEIGSEYEKYTTQGLPSFEEQEPKS